jgi:hypothetical protein
MRQISKWLRLGQNISSVTNHADAASDGATLSWPDNFRKLQEWPLKIEVGTLRVFLICDVVRGFS